MQDSKTLINQVAQDIAQSSKASPSPVESAGSPHQSQPRRPYNTETIEAINQVFTLFRVNYHNQYYKAFGSDELLIPAKKLWLESLSQFETETLLKGARRAIEQSEFLPTLKKMIDCCQGDLSSHGLKEAHSAYLEACHAPSPKARFNWSHPAVYHAGKNSDWHFLANNTERVAFPVFEKNYRHLCEQVLKGNQLSAPEVLALPEETETALSKDENRQRLAKLREQFDL